MYLIKVLEIYLDFWANVGSLTCFLKMVSHLHQYLFCVFLGFINSDIILDNMNFPSQNQLTIKKSNSFILFKYIRIFFKLQSSTKLELREERKKRRGGQLLPLKLFTSQREKWRMGERKEILFWFWCQIFLVLLNKN